MHTEACNKRRLNDGINVCLKRFLHPDIPVTVIPFLNKVSFIFSFFSSLMIQSFLFFHFVCNFQLYIQVDLIPKKLQFLLEQK